MAEPLTDALQRLMCAEVRIRSETLDLQCVFVRFSGRCTSGIYWVRVLKTMFVGGGNQR